MEDYGRYDYSQDMNQAPVNVPQAQGNRRKRIKESGRKKLERLL